MCCDAQPQRHLFSDTDAKHQLIAPVSAAATFVHEKARAIEDFGVMLCQPTRAHSAARLLVRGTDEDHVTIELATTCLEMQKRFELGDADALHVERTATVQVAVLYDTAERV